MDRGAAEPKWRLGRLRRRQHLSLPQQHSLRRSRRAARPADGRCQRPLRRHDGPARRHGGECRHGRRARLSSTRAAGGRQLVRPLGRQLRLWHLVGAVRAERGRPRRDRSVRAQGGRLADRHPERGRRLGRGLQQLQARLSWLRAGAVHRVADRLGAAGFDGGRRSGPSCRGARHRLSAAYPGHRRACGAQDAYTGGGFPRVFYLRYHGYPKFFPLWALARYRNLKRGNVRRVRQGM